MNHPARQTLIATKYWVRVLLDTHLAAIALTGVQSADDSQVIEIPDLLVMFLYMFVLPAILSIYVCPVTISVVAWRQSTWSLVKKALLVLGATALSFFYFWYLSPSIQ